MTKARSIVRNQINMKSQHHGALTNDNVSVL